MDRLTILLELVYIKTEFKNQEMETRKITIMCKLKTTMLKIENNLDENIYR